MIFVKVFSYGWIKGFRQKGFEVDKLFSSVNESYLNNVITAIFGFFDTDHVVISIAVVDYNLDLKRFVIFSNPTFCPRT